MYCGTVGPSVMCLVIKDHDGVRSEYRITLSDCSEKGVVMGNGGNRPLIFIPESHACLSKGHAYRLFVANGENSLHLYRPETRLHLILEKLN